MSEQVMDGVRVVEVALYALVPSAGAVLADWGADVIKIEHPAHGDPIRGLAAWGIPPGTGGVTYLWEVFNRGKRSVGVDVATPEGLDLVMELVDQADVFLTNFLTPARQRLGIDVEHVCARNPRIIYGRGTGQGNVGPDADKGGFDGISYWARSAAATSASPGDYGHPVPMPGPAFGDIQTGMHLAGGIAAALYRRERTGKGAVVDTSLLASGMWAMQASIAGAHVIGKDQLPKGNRLRPANPLTNMYRTSDDRHIALAMLEADRYWPAFCAAIDMPELVDDPRFATAEARLTNVTECVELLDDFFGKRTFDECKARLDSQEGQWTVMQDCAQVLADPQAGINGYVKHVDYPSGARLPLVSVPVQIDSAAPDLGPAPELGAHTEEVLLELGRPWEELSRLKDKGVIT